MKDPMKLVPVVRELRAALLRRRADCVAAAGSEDGGEGAAVAAALSFAASVCYAAGVSPQTFAMMVDKLKADYRAATAELESVCDYPTCSASKKAEPPLPN